MTPHFLSLVAGVALLTNPPPPPDPAPGPAPLAVESIVVQGLRRTARFHVPARLAPRPALVLALHGGGMDGESFRSFNAGAFDRLADEAGFVVAYPDGLGGAWNDCRAKAAHHRSLAGVDEVAFLRAVVRQAAARTGREFAGVFAVGYSNGGHLVFRLALEAPGDFAALAAIGAHLPVPEELACGPGASPVSLFLASGTADPINPWSGGEVLAPGGIPLGNVRSAEATADYFRALAGLPDEARVERHPDRNPLDGVRIESRRWAARHSNEVVLLISRGGGHTLPHPAAAFPAHLVGPTGRDMDGARAIWEFFARHLRRDGTRG